MDPSPHGSTRTREGCKLQRGAPEASAQAWLRIEDRVTHECRLTLSILRTSGRFALRPSARHFLHDRQTTSRTNLGTLHPDLKQT